MKRIPILYNIEPGKVILLIVGGLFELAQLQDLLFQFMLLFRPTWGNFNHPIALFGAMFLVASIMEYGLSDNETDNKVSWWLSGIAVVVALVVYERAFDTNPEILQRARIVQLIFSFVPVLVAITAHRLADEIPKTTDKTGVHENGYTEKKNTSRACQCGCGKHFDEPIKLGPNPRKYHPNCSYKMKKIRVYESRRKSI